MLIVFGKSILNGVFEQIHLLTKKYLKYQNTKYSICSISNTAHLCTDTTPDLLLLVQQKLCIVQYRCGSLSHSSTT